MDVLRIKAETRKISDKLIRVLRSSKTTDKEVADLLQALSTCQTSGELVTAVIALVGEQDTGKSTIINSLLHRLNLAKVSDGRQAYTHNATRYKYKPSAADDTMESDVTIKFLNEENLRPILKEHIDKYCYCHYYMDDELHVAEKYEPPRDHDMRSAQKNKNSTTEVDKHLAAIARDVFEIIFKIEDDLKAESELKNVLTRSDIENGNFLERCLVEVEERKAEAGRQRDTDIVEGHLHFRSVRDTNLGSIRDIAASLWPIVDHVIIATGSILFQNGIELLDLRGNVTLQFYVVMHN